MKTFSSVQILSGDAVREHVIASRAKKVWLLPDPLCVKLSIQISTPTYSDTCLLPLLHIATLPSRSSLPLEVFLSLPCTLLLPIFPPRDPAVPMQFEVLITT